MTKSRAKRFERTLAWTKAEQRQILGYEQHLLRNGNDLATVRDDFASLTKFKSMVDVPSGEYSDIGFLAALSAQGIAMELMRSPLFDPRLAW